jgi:hypothetical protein
MRYIAIAALVAALGLAGVLWWQCGTVTRLTDDNARLTRNAAALVAQADQARLAADVAAARAARERVMNAEATATLDAIRNLELGECADETLDDDLSAIFGGVRSTD